MDSPIQHISSMMLRKALHRSIFCSLSPLFLSFSPKPSSSPTDVFLMWLGTLFSCGDILDNANHLRSGTRFILRKKPSGTIISPVAHQVDREYRVLEALGRVKGFPVPKVYCLCMDTSIIGTAFYVRHSIHQVPQNSVRMFGS